MDERVIAVEWFMKGVALKGADPNGAYLRIK